MGYSENDNGGAQAKQTASMMSHASLHKQTGALARLSLLPKYAFDFHFTSFLEISPYIIRAQLKKLIPGVLVRLPRFFTLGSFSPTLLW